jgi:hypothetical protein
MAAEPVDLGYGAEPAARFGLVYEAEWGGSESGTYVVVDRVQGFPTAWQMRVAREDSNRKTQERLDKLRELVAGENDRWRSLSEAERSMIRNGGRDGLGVWRGDSKQEVGQMTV